MKYILPKPVDDDLFEDIVCDIYSRIFQNPNLQRYGRSGQKQHGIDIFGKDYVSGQLQAIQCKCHPDDTTINDTKIIKEIDKELVKLDSSEIEVANYIFVTSAKRTTTIQDHVREINEKRNKNKKCNVEVVFWDFLQKEIMGSADLLYRYFFKLLPNPNFGKYILPGLNKKDRNTLSLYHEEIAESDAESIRDRLVDSIAKTLGAQMYNITSEYSLSLGLHSNDSDYENVVDLDICFKTLFQDENNLEKKLNQQTELISKICDAINLERRFSKQIIIYLDTEISLAFLLGIILRKRKFNPIFVFKDQAWPVGSTSFNQVSLNLKEYPPQILESEGKDVIFVFSCVPTFDFVTEKNKFLKLAESSETDVRFLLGFESKEIETSAYALDVAKEIASKINSLNTWGIKKVHLILIAPKPIAGLIGYQLNTLNIKITPYFLDQKRETYLPVGQIDNNLLR